MANTTTTVSDLAQDLYNNSEYASDDYGLLTTIVGNITGTDDDDDGKDILNRYLRPIIVL